MVTGGREQWACCKHIFKIDCTALPNRIDGNDEEKKFPLLLMRQGEWIMVSSSVRKRQRNLLNLRQLWPFWIYESES